MSVPLDPWEIDELDEDLLEEMDREALTGFRERLLATLDDLQVSEPDIDEDDEEYYEWEDRISVLQDMIDAIGDRLGE